MLEDVAEGCPEGCQTLFLVSHSARKNQKQSLTPRSVRLLRAVFETKNKV